MRTLYIECNRGAAGDMLMAALYELLDDKEGFLNVMNHLGLPGVRLEAQPGSSCGIAGIHMKVTVHGEEEKEPRPPDAGRPLTGTIIMAVIIMRLRGTLPGSSTDWNSRRK